MGTGSGAEITGPPPARPGISVRPSGSPTGEGRDAKNSAGATRARSGRRRRPPHPVRQNRSGPDGQCRFGRRPGHRPRHVHRPRRLRDLLTHRQELTHRTVVRVVGRRRRFPRRSLLPVRLARSRTGPVPVVTVPAVGVRTTPAVMVRAIAPRVTGTAVGGAGRAVGVAAVGVTAAGQPVQPSPADRRRQIGGRGDERRQSGEEAGQRVVRSQVQVGCKLRPPGRPRQRRGAGGRATGAAPGPSPVRPPPRTRWTELMSDRVPDPAAVQRTRTSKSTQVRRPRRGRRHTYDVRLVSRLRKSG